LVGGKGLWFNLASFRGDRKMAYVLLVTWIIHGQPPSSYQTQFTSSDKCITARDAVLADGQRIKNEFDQRQIAAAQATGAPPAIFLAGNIAPEVSAICTAQ
jgi:hypothetical protein